MKVYREKGRNLLCFFLWKFKRVPVFMAGALLIFRSLLENGMGTFSIPKRIEKEDLKHIFERLYKCDKGRSDKGSGLGLSIVHQLVEKMGGSITVESVPGKGTEFTLLFPLEI